VKAQGRSLIRSYEDSSVVAHQTEEMQGGSGGLSRMGRDAVSDTARSSGPFTCTVQARAGQATLRCCDAGLSVLCSWRVRAEQVSGAAVCTGWLAEVHQGRRTRGTEVIMEKFKGDWPREIAPVDQESAGMQLSMASRANGPTDAGGCE